MRASHDHDARKYTTVSAHVLSSSERRAEASLLSEREIKAILRSRRRIKELARAFGVSAETMSLIRSGKL